MNEFELKYGCNPNQKHVSPAGVAVAKQLTESERKMYFVEQAEVSRSLRSHELKTHGEFRC